MEKRNILRKTKSQVKEQPTPKEENVLGDETFKEEKEEKEDEVEVDNEIAPPEPKKRGRKKKVKEEKDEKEEPVVEIKPKNEKENKYAHLEKARQKSLEARRKKKEEKIRLQIEAEQLQEQLRQQKEENERLRAGASKPVPQLPQVPQVPQVPQTPKSVMDIDYDKLAERIYGKFQHMETGIREQERQLAEKKYKEELKAYEDRMAAERKPQPVTRTQLYTSQRKKPNRAFERGGSTGYWGMGN